MDASVQFHTLAALTPVPELSLKLPVIDHKSPGHTPRDLIYNVAS